MRFGTLENIGLSALTHVFNEAFADYELNLQFTEEGLSNKINVEDINLSASVAAFENEVPVGFILFGLDNINNRIVAWDGGTGVIPACRGRKLTRKMFDYALPRLQQSGVEKILLEVLKNNKGAYSIYEQIGFKTSRELYAYKGIVKSGTQPYRVEIMKNNGEGLLNLADWQPAWQQMSKRVNNHGDAVTVYCIKERNNIVAYACANSSTGRILQFAVAKEHRQRGMATALFNEISKGRELTIINVDAGDTGTNTFLQSIGMKIFNSQYEMEMAI